MGKESPFSWFCPRERKGREEESPSFSLRSMEFRRLEFVRPRMKVHRIDEGYAWVPKTWDFTEDPNEDFDKSKVFGFRKCPRGFLGFLLLSKR